MEIYLLRHADAVEQAPGQPDAERELTGKGIKQTARVADWLDSRGVEVQCVISSPLLRAVQTAEPVAEALDVEMLTDNRLSGGRLTVQALAELVEELGHPDSIMLVGHEPDFSALIEELTGGQVEVKKAAVALVACDRIGPGQGLLRLLVPPRLI